MTVEKFKHLDSKKPKVDQILKTPVELVDKEQLSVLWNHFYNIKEKYSKDKDIAKAATDIIEKINKIINLWNNRISWEIMKVASNDDKYSNSIVI